MEAVWDDYYVFMIIYSFKIASSSMVLEFELKVSVYSIVHE